MDLCKLPSVPQQSVTNTNTPIDSLTKYMYGHLKKKLNIHRDHTIRTIDCGHLMKMKRSRISNTNIYKQEH